MKSGQNTERIDFIKKNMNEDLHKLSLKKSSYSKTEFLEILNEIKCRQKLKEKFPSWAENFLLQMPKPENIEQSSSFETAQFKSQIYKFTSSLDLSAGFGIDSYFFALHSENHTAIEPNSNLYNILKNNFKALHINNSFFINQDADTFLNKNSLKYDLVFIDPSRRNNLGQRKIDLNDYEPNIISLFQKIKKTCRYLIVKLSPMLDFTFLKNQFPEINRFYIISIDGECKEILLAFDFISPHKTLQYYAVELGKSKFNYIFEEDNNLEIDYSMPKKYIYDIHPVIKKTGFYDNYAMGLGLSKLNKNSHLYTSDELKSNFKGKTYKFIDYCKPDYKELKNIISDCKAIVVRYGFPLTVENIRKKYSILEGKDKTVFAVKLLNNKNYFVIAERIN